MEKRKKNARALAALFLCVLFLIPLNACSRKPEASILTQPTFDSERAPDAEDARAILEYLTSPQLQGRAVGSDGNVTAADYIADTFLSLGYEPFGEDYCIPYDDALVRQETAEASLILIGADGKRTALEAGKDFTYYPVYEPIDVTLPVSESVEEAQTGSAILLAGDNGRLLAGDDPEIIVFHCADLDTAMTLNTNLSTDRGAYFQIDSSFETLLTQPATQTEIHLGACAERGQAMNVAAVRHGSDSRNAMIISAHFDGSGFCGGIYYPSAYDNGSGTTAMLLAAALLRDAQLEPDLIFAAFNGEETWLHGSSALAEQLCRDYENVTVVNIDCVGLVGENGFTVSGNEMLFAPLTRRIENYALCPEVMTSDNLSFDGISNATATNLSDVNAIDYATTVMHTQGDTAESIDPARLLQAASLVADYAAGGEYTVSLEPDFDNTKCLYEVPYDLNAYEGAKESFFASLPRTFGSAFEGTYQDFKTVESETGLRLLYPETGVDENGMRLSVWSPENQAVGTAPAYDVSGFYTSSYEGLSVWNSWMLYTGREIQSSVQFYGNKDAAVLETTCSIQSLNVEVRFYEISESGPDPHRTAASFIVNDVLYSCEMNGTAEQMERYLEQFHFDP